jgi:hypothetical protein
MEKAKREYHILNLGAGVQSTTLFLMIREGVVKLPTDTVAVFADTQEEPSAVYRHLEWLKSLEWPRILTATAGKLGDHLIAGINSTGQEFMTLPAYLADGGMGVRQCSKQYKVEVIERAIRRQLLGLKPRQRIPKSVTVIQYFGISRDEARRALRIKARMPSARFPLLELGLTRGDCLRWLSTRVPHQVPKSACVFCPYQTNTQWRGLTPSEWARAVSVDRAIRMGRKHRRFLHPSRKPLEEVDLTEKQASLGFAGECEGMCGV